MLFKRSEPKPQSQPAPKIEPAIKSKVVSKEEKEEKERVDYAEQLWEDYFDSILHAFIDYEQSEDAAVKRVRIAASNMTDDRKKELCVEFGLNYWTHGDEDRGWAIMDHLSELARHQLSLGRHQLAMGRMLVASLSPARGADNIADELAEQNKDLESILNES